MKRMPFWKYLLLNIVIYVPVSMYMYGGIAKVIVLLVALEAVVGWVVYVVCVEIRDAMSEGEGNGGGAETR